MANFFKAIEFSHGRCYPPATAAVNQIIHGFLWSSGRAIQPPELPDDQTEVLTE